MIDEKVLIERLNEIEEHCLNVCDWQGQSAIEDAIAIANQLAEEQNNGWIPCSERLPNEKGDYLVACNDGKVRVWWFVVEGDFKCWLSGVHQLKPIAWMPLPAPYQQKGE